MPQWLFAFDAMTWASLRAPALVAAHPDAVQRARAELSGAPDLPILRAALLESVWLWPTTPAILRDTTEVTRWESGLLPAGASVVVFAPFFHRDGTRLPQAHRFAPELWLGERRDDDWPLVPFSAGPGMCPGRNVVLLTARHEWELSNGRVDADHPLPSTLDPFGLRFTPRPPPGARPSGAAGTAPAVRPSHHPGARASEREQLVQDRPVLVRDATADPDRTVATEEES